VSQITAAAPGVCYGTQIIFLFLDGNVFASGREALMANPNHKSASSQKTQATSPSGAQAQTQSGKNGGTEKHRPKRAITLGGGGPAAGLHIGVLGALEKLGIEFDVWALSCIGAWVGIVYNQWEKGNKADQTFEFFERNVFRSDESYKGFPVNSVFGPDWANNTMALWKFLGDGDSYKNALLPTEEFVESLRATWTFWTNPSKWNAESGEFNNWMLNDVLAVNPLTRFLTSMMYLSPMNGLSRIYYPESDLLKSIKFDRLKDLDAYIYHNAWDLSEKKIKLFYNKPIAGKAYERISDASLCACSALPFVESTVKASKLGEHTYCEGALVDTVSFRDLLEDHFDLEEIWVNRIVDSDQVCKPINLHDSLGNLCELFAATVGEDDVKLFKYHVEFDDIKLRDGTWGKWKGKVIDIQVSKYVDYQWTHKNLAIGREEGAKAAKAAHDAYLAAPDSLFINEPESEAQRRRRRRGLRD
jgi:predicted acylesterase/phospholipase RssA